MRNIFIATISCCHFLLSCSDDRVMHYGFGTALGTTYHIKYMAPPEEECDYLFDSIFNEVTMSLSNYHEESLLYKINKQDTYSSGRSYDKRCIFDVKRYLL